MCLAMTGMLKTTGDAARTLRIKVEKLQRHCAKRSKIMSGQEAIAIMFENFRSSDLRDILCKKVRDSAIMKFDLSFYDQLPNSDARKTYELLSHLTAPIFM